MTESEPTFAHYVDLLRRQVWRIVLLTALAIAAAAVASLTREPVYRASTQIVVGQGGGVFQAQFGSAVEPFTQTMTNLLKSNVVAETVVTNLNLNTTPENLLKHVDVSTKPQSSVLDVNFDAPLDENPVEVLLELGEVFTALVDQKLGEGRATTGNEAALPVITATVFDPAHLQAAKVSPRVIRNIVIAGLLGLALSLIFAVVRDSSDVRIRRKSDAEEWFGSPVVGTLPKGLRGKPPFGLAAARPVSRNPMFANALQLLRANLEFSSVNGPTIVVTSALPEEGKSTVAANLSVALASAGNDVICVEGDVRKPRLHEYLGVTAQVGLVDVLEGRSKLDMALVDVPLTNSMHFPAVTKPRSGTNRPPGSAGTLRALLSGRRPTEPMLGQLFTSERVDQLINALARQAKYVIFDTPPLLLVGDAFPLLARADSILVVAREGHTTKDSAESVQATLRALGATSTAVIVTDARSTVGYGYEYGYGTTADRLSAV